MNRIRAVILAISIVLIIAYVITHLGKWSFWSNILNNIFLYQIHRFHGNVQMNAKKKSKKLIGVVILGILIIIFSTIMLCVFIADFINYKLTDIYTISYLVIILGFLLSGIFVLKRREWARKIVILLLLCFIIDTFVPLKYFVEAIRKQNIPALTIIALGLILFISTIYYFMRKNVRSFFIEE